MWAQDLVENLNRNALAKARARDPGADWAFYAFGDRTLALSPDGQQARELEADGYWRFIVAEYVRAKEAAGELRRLAPRN